MKQSFFILILAVLIPVCLAGCAPAEEDADSITDTAIQGISGQGKISGDKPTKDAFGSEYQ